jgi:thioredoxin-like negative regulator of GroEL
MIRTRRVWHRSSILFLGVIVVAMLVGVRNCRNARWLHSSLAESRKNLAAGHPGRAAQILREILAWKPDSDEAAYLLGSCEKTRGQSAAASAAWARVAPDSPFGSQAIQGRTELEIARGHLAEAEQLVRDALADPRTDGFRLAPVLALIYAQGGRTEEAGWLIEQTWNRITQTGHASWERAIPLVRLHVRLRIDPPPVAAVRAFLDQAGRRNAEDDRVWLGRAHVAMQDADYAEAKRWLDKCLSRRPRDVPVRRAQLAWAMATNQIDTIREAARHLPAELMPASLVHNLMARIAGIRGDITAERSALQRVLGDDPTDLASRARLIDLATNGGEPEIAVRLRTRQVEIHDAQARFLALDHRNQPFRDSEELAHLAEELGQVFEARAFLTVALSVSPKRHDLRHDLTRLDRDVATKTRPGQTLAQMLSSTQEKFSSGGLVNPSA